MIASCGFCALQIIDCVPHGNRMLDSVDEFLHSFFVGCSGGSMCPHYKAKNPAKTNLPWLGNMVLQTLPESLQENVPPSWVWLVVGPWAASKMLLRKSLWNRTTWLIPCFVISENLLLILSFSLANQAFWKAKRFFGRECGQLVFFSKIDVKQVYLGKCHFCRTFWKNTPITPYCANSLPAFAFPT